jgi:hypothetical protein
MFSLNFKDIGVKLLPPVLKKERMIALVSVCLHPLKYVNDLLNALRDEKNYFLRFNGQIIYLEHFLNDQYDPVYRRIYIEDVANLEPIYLYNNAEERTPVYLHNKEEGADPVYMINRREYILEFEYIVKVPNDLVFNEIEMRSKINRYNIAGKRYIIEVI